jgi:hypothetical protein
MRIQMAVHGTLFLYTLLVPHADIMLRYQKTKLNRPSLFSFRGQQRLELTHQELTPGADE